VSSSVSRRPCLPFEFCRRRRIGFQSDRFFFFFFSFFLSFFLSSPPPPFSLLTMSLRQLLPTLEPRLTSPRFYSPHSDMLTNDRLLLEAEIQRRDRVHLPPAISSLIQRIKNLRFLNIQIVQGTSGAGIRDQATWSDQGCETSLSILENV